MSISCGSAAHPRISPVDPLCTTRGLAVDVLWMPGAIGVELLFVLC
jgi:hypothetical protein